MKRLVVSRSARADLRAIARYTEAEWDAIQRKRYLAAIQERFSILRSHAELGRRRPDLSPEYRSLPVGAHLIFYRTTSSAIVIVRVLHQAMDAKRRL